LPNSSRTNGHHLVEINEMVSYWLVTVFACFFCFVDYRKKISEIGIFQYLGKLTSAPEFISIVICFDRLIFNFFKVNDLLNV